MCFASRCKDAQTSTNGRHNLASTMLWFKTFHATFVCVSTYECVEVRGHLSGVVSVLLPCEWRGSNTGCQAWQYVPLTNESSYKPRLQFKKEVQHLQLFLLLFLAYGLFACVFHAADVEARGSGLMSSSTVLCLDPFTRGFSLNTEVLSFSCLFLPSALGRVVVTGT